MKQMTPEELAQAQQRYEEMKASFAVEDIHFTDEEDTFLRDLYAQGLGVDESDAAVMAFLKEKGYLPEEG